MATIDRRAGDPVVTSLGLPVRAFTAEALAAVDVPTPSEVVRAAVGTASVAEAAALLAAGPGAELVVPKLAGKEATVAIARRRGPRGHLAVVGLGPGDVAHRTPAAETAVRRAEVVIGYGPYVDACADLLTAAQEVVRSPIGDETVRAKQAVAEAGAGRRVALVCSGDAGVYAMASLTLEVAGDAGVDVEIVPGVTAALAASALLGAPLGHDHVIISLSDLLTPWSAIEGRLRAAAEADLVVALYNPRSRGRTWQFDAACDILRAHRPAGTPVGVVTDASRPAQSVHLTTLEAVDAGAVGMTTCVIVGSSTTRVIGGRMVTPGGTTPVTVAIDLRCTGCGACLVTCPERALVAAPRRPLVLVDRCTTCHGVRRGLPRRRHPGAHRMTAIHPIEAESYRILAERVDLSAFGPLGAAVVARVIHASADLEYATTMVVDEAALEAGVAALVAGAPVLVDVEMVRHGITGVDARCFLPERATEGTTRSAAGMAAAAEAHPHGAVVVVGCAPTALDEVVRLHDAGTFRPALVIGMPVGFVGAAESKERLRASGLPAVSNIGEKGGSAVAAAALNALVRLARG